MVAEFQTEHLPTKSRALHSYRPVWFQYFFFLWGGTYVTRYCGHLWPIVQPQMIDEGDCGALSIAD
jgi:hypothetical protein